ncbi:hypothetical protein [Amycolatopsis sp. GM8]|uniref:hypothetical protein n=1 Tax=Amycolatopsis sp. GM8 TaxID=2896530 RepID=UPI002714CE9D|nr:hypothetical protein [Amycolatopsis sp. GM8]
MGKHLVAAGGLIDTDPEAALQHARYAKAKASRVPIVREALGLVSYHAGNWAEALSELRAVRRMTRLDTHVAVIADAERALGRPERALDLAKEVAGANLPRDVEVELRIVAAGARRDMGQLDAAVVSLQGPDLNAAKRDPWSARLFYAYADNLAAAGRRDEAIEWFLNAAQADADEETDAAERAAALSNDDLPLGDHAYEADDQDDDDFEDDEDDADEDDDFDDEDEELDGADGELDDEDDADDQDDDFEDDDEDAADDEDDVDEGDAGEDEDDFDDEDEELGDKDVEEPGDAATEGTEAAGRDETTAATAKTERRPDGD